MMFSIKNFFSKCDQIRRNLRIWSHLLKKSLMENFIFCAVFIQFLNHDETGKLIANALEWVVNSGQRKIGWYRKIVVKVSCKLSKLMKFSEWFLQFAITLFFCSRQSWKVFPPFLIFGYHVEN